MTRILRYLFLIITLYCAAITLTNASETSELIHKNEYCAQSTLNGPIFSIEKNGRVATILGTLHVSSTLVRDISIKNYMSALQKADILVTEAGVPISSSSITAGQAFESAHSLRYFVDDDTLSSLASYTGMPNIGRMNVISAILNVTSAISGPSNELIQRLDIRNDGGVDNILIAEAERTDKPISRLETTEFIDAAKRIPSEDIEAFMKAAIIKLKTPKEETKPLQDGLVEQFFSAWANGDVDQVQKIQTAMDTATLKEPRLALISSLNPTRNSLMVTKIEALLQNTNHRYLFAVGAAHLGGENGLLALLKHNGYQIQCD
jgi:uncharacterized protein